MPAIWSEEVTHKFVMLYREHECLWNKATAAYQNQKAKHSALLDMCDKMEMQNFGINDARKQISRLWATFKQEQNKIRRSKLQNVGTKDVYRPPMKWFPLMKDIMKQRSLSNLVSKFVWVKGKFIWMRSAASPSLLGWPLFLFLFFLLPFLYLGSQGVTPSRFLLPCSKVSRQSTPDMDGILEGGPVTLPQKHPLAKNRWKDKTRGRRVSRYPDLVLLGSLIGWQASLVHMHRANLVLMTGAGQNPRDLWGGAPSPPFCFEGGWRGA